MNFCINNKEYNIDEEITIYDFLINNKIFIARISNEINDLIYEELCYVEIEGEETLKCAKTEYITDGMKIYTNSKKVYSFYNEQISKNYSFYQNYYKKNIELDDSKYNVLLCQPEIYNECLQKYKNNGFDDIVNVKFAQIIAYIEIANIIIKRCSNKLDKKTLYPLYVVLQNLIDETKYQVNIKQPEELAATIIKTYYKKVLKINKNINIIYITKSVASRISHNLKYYQFNPMVDDVVLFNRFSVLNGTNNFNGIIQNAIYQEDSNNYNNSCSFNDIFRIIKQTGLVEENIEITHIDNDIEIIVKYRGVELKTLITKRFLTLEEVENIKYDVIITTTRKNIISYDEESSLLDDYNINLIYKKLLISPGYSKILNRR